MKKYILTIIVLICISIASVLNAQSCTQCTNTTTGINASAIGENTNGTGFASFASGYEVSSIGDFAFGHGKFMTVNGANSLILGKYAETNSSHAMIIGYGVSNTNRLINTISNSLMVGFDSDQPSLFVGPSLGQGTTGKVSIGNVTSPQAKLHIKADGGEAVDLLLEAGNSAAIARLKFGITSTSTSPNRIEASQEGDLNFHTASEYVFWDGNVGINNYNPTEKLEVNGNIKTTGFILADGQQAANKILQSDANGMATWVDPMTLSMDDGDWEKASFSDNIYRVDGNVGIGTSSPIVKLHVSDGDIFIDDIEKGIVMKSPDGNCWRGTLDNTGQLNFVKVNCDSLASISNQAQKPILNIKVYPNPVKDKLTIETEKTIEDGTLQIFNLNGGLVWAIRLENSKTTINTTMLPPANYIIAIIDKSGNTVWSRQISII